MNNSPEASIENSAPAPSIENLPAEEVFGARYQFVNDVHNYTDNQIRFAEAKAGLIIGACGILLSTSAIPWATLGHLFNAPFTLWHWVLCALGALMCVALMMTASLCINCIFPRLGTPGDGYIYFGDIVGSKETKERARDEFARAMRGWSQEQMVTIMAQHTYDLAVIAKRKHKLARQAMICFLVLAVLGVAFSLVATAVAQFS